VTESSIRWPAEWEEHRATWLAWPHNKEDFPGVLEEVRKSCASFISELSKFETVELICENETETRIALEKRVSKIDNINFHQFPTDRSWLRDSAPTAVKLGEDLVWTKWNFNAWAKYPNFQKDQALPEYISENTGKRLVQALREDGITPFTLEGGAIETDGAGSLMVTEQCLLSEVQQRNLNCGKDEYERLLLQYLGVRNTIWLEAGVPGDDTHGHIDDLARFVSSESILLVFDERDPEFRDVSRKNLEIAKKSSNALGDSISVSLLPLPDPVIEDGELLPASYANFYLANNSVFVPVFKDRSDDKALRIIDDSFPDRNTLPVDCRAWIVGCGTLHCSTQQEFQVRTCTKGV